MPTNAGKITSRHVETGGPPSMPPPCISTARRSIWWPRKPSMARPLGRPTAYQLPPEGGLILGDVRPLDAFTREVTKPARAASNIGRVVGPIRVGRQFCHPMPPYTRRHFARITYFLSIVPM